MNHGHREYSLLILKCNNVFWNGGLKTFHFWQKLIDWRIELDVVHPKKINLEPYLFKRFGYVLVKQIIAINREVSLLCNGSNGYLKIGNFEKLCAKCVLPFPRYRPIINVTMYI